MNLSADPLKAAKKNEFATIYTKEAENLKGQTVPVLFLGDSITHGWAWSTNAPSNPGGLEIWNEKFAEFKPVNFAIAGDRVEHVLWRITEGGQLDGFNAKLIVVMIGVSNLLHEEKPDSVAAGIINLNKVIESKQPGATILLLGILPYSWDRTGTVEKVNKIISTSADNKKIFYFDMTAKFKNEKNETANMRDGIHPSPDGYKIMAAELLPEIKKLLNDKELSQ